VKPITADVLANLYGAPVDRMQPFAGPLAAAMARYEIDRSVNRAAAFLATVGHESAGLSRLSENLNYSAQGLANTWPSRYAERPREVIKVPNAKAIMLSRRPEAIANNVYAGRMGNGDEASGDGWRYRGAGAIQLTGKANQQEYAWAVGRPVETIGDYLRTPEGAADSAGWFWARRDLNHYAENGDMRAVTGIVNGGTVGLPERTKLFARAKGLLA
jgi:putative chitinase